MHNAIPSTETLNGHYRFLASLPHCLTACLLPHTPRLRAHLPYVPQSSACAETRYES
jgi:hypothetical protein